jgi:hypothetical protein
MGERKLVRKRISLLLVTLMLALTMSFGGAGAAFADPDCGQVGGNNKNCVKKSPGKSADNDGQAKDKNPNVETTFKGRPQ